MDNDLVQLIQSFGFSELQQLIMLIALVFLLANFLGGCLSSIFLAFGGAAKRRKAMDRMSVRLMLLAELFVFLWAIYYHAAVVMSIQVEQLVFWVATLIVGPLLSFIGSQITGLMFYNRIQTNYKAYAKVLARRKAKRDAKRGGGKAKPA